MAPQFPSIQSFFEKEVLLEKDLSGRASRQACSHDGFTKEEIEAALLPTCTLHNWLPRGEYQTVDISTLVPGPGCVTFMGRVVNFCDQHTPSKKLQAAKGCLKVVIKDDTGALMVSSLNPSISLVLYTIEMQYIPANSRLLGQVVVRQGTIQFVSWAACIYLDSSYLQYGDQFLDLEKCKSYHQHIPRERQQLLLYDSRK